MYCRQRSQMSPSIPRARARRSVRKTEKAIQYDNERGRKKRLKTIPAPKIPPTPSSTYDELTPRAPCKSSGTKLPSVSETLIASHSHCQNVSPVREHDPRNLEDMFKEVQEKVPEVEEKEQEVEVTNVRCILPHGTEESRVPQNNKIELPAMMAGVSVATLLAIDRKMNHKALVFPRTTVAGEEFVVDFLLKGTQIAKSDVMALSLDVSVEDKSELFAGYAILDLATQWTFWDKASHKSWCSFPAAAFEMMKKDANFSTNKDLRGLISTQQYSLSFLQYEVLDITVYHQQHFSKVFVVNAHRIKDRSFLILNKGSDPAPCIVYANSLTNKSKVHNAESVAKIIRMFLNSYDKATNDSTGRSFTRTSLPVYQIFVPTQQDGWTCAYHTIAVRFHFMEAFSKRNVVYMDLEDKFNSFSIDFFSYDVNEVLSIRQDLLCLARCLKRLKEAQLLSGTINANFLVDLNSIENVEASDFCEAAVAFQPCIKRENIEPKSTRNVGARKAQVRIATLRTKRAKRVEVEERLKRFHGKLNSNQRSNTQELIDKTFRVPERFGGMPAVNLESYKDRQFRRQLFMWSKETLRIQSTLSYESQQANNVLPKCEAIGIFHDPIGEYPDRRGSQYQPLRNSPLRIAIAQSKQAFDSFIDELIKNRSKYIVVQNELETDKLVLGNQRAPLPEFLGRCRNKRDAQLQYDNQVLLANAKVIEETPSKDSGDRVFAKRVVPV